MEKRIKSAVIASFITALFFILLGIASVCYINVRFGL